MAEVARTSDPQCISRGGCMDREQCRAAGCCMRPAVGAYRDATGELVIPSERIPPEAKAKQDCTCTDTCARRGRPFPADWSWRCQGFPYTPTELDMHEREQESLIRTSNTMPECSRLFAEYCKTLKPTAAPSEFEVFMAGYDAAKRLQSETGERPIKPITLYGEPDSDVGLKHPECWTALNIGGHQQAILIVTKMEDGSPVPPYAQAVIAHLLRGVPYPPTSAKANAKLCPKCNRTVTEGCNYCACPYPPPSKARCGHGNDPDSCPHPHTDTL